MINFKGTHYPDKRYPLCRLFLHKPPLRTEYIKASIRAKVEHPFRVIKRQFGFRKVIYRGLEKNDNKLAMLFPSAFIETV